MTTPIRPLTVKELADLLGVSVDWVYTQVEARSIPCTRLPGKSKTGARRLIRFTAEHVKAILADGEEPVLTVPAISLARARAARATPNPPRPQPRPDPKPDPRPRPGTPAPSGPGTPRQPSRPGRVADAALHGPIGA